LSSRRAKGRIVALCTPWRNAEDSGIDKQDVYFDFCKIPHTRGFRFFLVLALVFLFGRRVICGFGCPCVGIRETVGFAYRSRTLRGPSVWRLRHVKWLFFRRPPADPASERQTYRFLGITPPAEYARDGQSTLPSDPWGSQRWVALGPFFALAALGLTRWWSRRQA